MLLSGLSGFLSKLCFKVMFSHVIDLFIENVGKYFSNINKKMFQKIRPCVTYDNKKKKDGKQSSSKKEENKSKKYDRREN